MRPPVVTLSEAAASVRGSTGSMSTSTRATSAAAFGAQRPDRAEPVATDELFHLESSTRQVNTGAMCRRPQCAQRRRAVPIARPTHTTWPTSTSGSVAAVIANVRVEYVILSGLSALRMRV